MSSQWHYSKGGSHLGPVSSDRLKELAASGELAPADLVWKEGLSDWRPASTLKGLFPEPPVKPAGPPPLPTATPNAPPSPPPSVVEMDAPDAVATTAEAVGPTAPRKPDFFDKARALAQKAQAKAEEFQREAQAKAERMQEQARANPNAAQVAITRGAKAAMDYARSEEAKELARKTRDTVKGGAMAATALAGAASAEGRERVRKAAEHPLGVGAALLFFFPLGLYLVWHHPHWTQTRKWAWTGAWLGCFCLILMPALMAPRIRPTENGVGGQVGTGVEKSAAIGRSASEDTSGYSQGKLTSFEDDPPPVIQGLAQGNEVWVLDDCTTATKPQPGKRHVLYVVLSGDDLACVVEKLYEPPGLGAERLLGTKEGGTLWIKYPAGEFRLKSGKVAWTWVGQKHKGGDFDEGADEAMTLKGIEDFKGTPNSTSGSRIESSGGALISLRRFGEDIRWELQASYSGTLIGKRGKLPPTVDSRNASGTGRRLRPGSSSGQRYDARPSHSSNNPTGRVTPRGGVTTPTSGLTADELRGKIVGEDFRPRSKFYDLYGDPNRVVDIGDKTFLYYTCKDGNVVIECPKGPFQYDDDLAPLSVDRR